MAASAFSIDITLPAFSATAADLGAPYERVQLTVTVYIFALGIGQLFWGSASDRFGRKRALAAGLSIYLAGSLLSIMAPSIDWLLAGRLLQGVGGAAAAVCSRAIIRDLFSGAELARNLALATAVFALGPIVAPLIGAVIAELTSWRFVFVAMALLGLLLLVLLIRMPETIPERSPDALDPRVMLRRARRLMLHRQSGYFLALTGIILSTMILILSGAPRIYEAGFGVTGLWFAFLFALHGLGIIVGQIANRRLITLIGTERSMILASVVLVVASGLMYAGALTGVLTAINLSALLVLFATSYLIVYSNAAALVLDPHGDIAGFAASFYGFVGQIVSAIIVSGLVYLAGESVEAWSGLLLLICVVCFVAASVYLLLAKPGRVLSRNR